MEMLVAQAVAAVELLTKVPQVEQAQQVKEITEAGALILEVEAVARVVLALTAANPTPTLEVMAVQV
jgi:hypothetical protein